MRHKWSTEEGIHVLMNANDGKRILAFIGQVGEGFALKIPYLLWDRDIKNFQNASIYNSLEEAKIVAEKEIKRRIAGFISPAV